MVFGVSRKECSTLMGSTDDQLDFQPCHQHDMLMTIWNVYEQVDGWDPGWAQG